MFDIEIAGQTAAWFLRKSPGNSMPHTKLMKLLYLSERTSIGQRGYPILGDRLVAMPCGPVLGNTLNYMKGHGRSDNGWAMWVSPIKNHEVFLMKECEPEDLDLLGNVTLEILAQVRRRFGHMNQWGLGDYIHRNCREWKNPGDSSFEITYERLLYALGYSREKAAEAGTELEAQREIDEILLSQPFFQKDPFRYKHGLYSTTGRYADNSVQ